MLVELRVDQLRATEALKWDLYHPCGRLILPAGKNLTAAHIAKMKRAGIEQLFACQTEDDAAEVRRRAPKTPVPLGSLEPGRPVPYHLYHRHGALLVAAGRRVSRGQLADLRRRGVVTAYRLSPEREAEKRLLADDFVTDVILSLDAMSNDLDALRLRPSSDPASDQVDPLRTSRTDHEREECTALVERTHQHADEALSRLADGQTVQGQEISDASQALMRGLLVDKNMLLAMVAAHGDDEQFLVGHSVNVTMLALAIGMQMGLDAPQLTALGRTALLHDVGMLEVPTELLYKRETLTPAERHEILKHPVRGLSVLEQIIGVDDMTRFVVYQEHEREGGKGYPRRRSGKLIADMARIIAVADTFEAIASPRPYRAAKLPYQSMAEVVRMAGSGQLHPPMVRALLSAVGLFPIGSLVKLSDGAIGRVVAVNGARYDRPLVARLRDPGGQALPGDVIDLSAQPQEDLKVAGPISGADVEVEPTEGF